MLFREQFVVHLLSCSQWQNQTLACKSTHQRALHFCSSWAYRDLVVISEKIPLIISSCRREWNHTELLLFIIFIIVRFQFSKVLWRIVFLRWSLICLRMCTETNMCANAFTLYQQQTRVSNKLRNKRLQQSKRWTHAPMQRSKQCRCKHDAGVKMDLLKVLCW